MRSKARRGLGDGESELERGGLRALPSWPLSDLPRGPRRAAKSAWALQQRQHSSRAAVQGPTISQGQGLAQEQGWGGSKPQPRLEAAKPAPARMLDFPGASTPVSNPILTTASLAGALGPASLTSGLATSYLSPCPRLLTLHGGLRVYPASRPRHAESISQDPPFLAL